MLIAIESERKKATKTGKLKDSWMYMRRAMVKVNKQICRNKHEQVAEVVILRRRERDRKRHTSFRIISKIINLDVK